MNLSGSQVLPAFLQVLLFLYFRSSLLSDSRAQFSPDLSYSNVASVIHSSLLQLSFFLQRVQSSSCLVCSVECKQQVRQTQCWFLCHVLAWPSLVKLTTTATPSLLENLFSSLACITLSWFSPTSTVPLFRLFYRLKSPWPSGHGPCSLFLIYTHSLLPLLSYILT